MTANLACSVIKMTWDVNQFIDSCVIYNKASANTGSNEGGELIHAGHWICRAAENSKTMCKGARDERQQT